jgi:hypothetical protein
LRSLTASLRIRHRAWTGDKLFGWEATKILHGTGLNSTGKLTNHHSYYTCAHFQERLRKYLGLDALLVAAEEHEALYPDRSPHSKSCVVEAPVCFIFETVDEVAASTFVRNVLVKFAINDEYYPHDVGTEIPQNKLGNSWGYLTELVAQATGPLRPWSGRGLRNSHCARPH